MLLNYSQTIHVRSVSAYVAVTRVHQTRLICINNLMSLKPFPVKFPLCPRQTEPRLRPGLLGTENIKR